ncbi:hypothetical protein KSP40_PGU010157 [Platanthera guangdongensis]|uniref:Uncharacterized protein n=1 Tax=Platanthera guangdongensis TaxID=2320717 RepID=A0ABR2MJG9_9ASPA
MLEFQRQLGDRWQGDKDQDLGNRQPGYHFRLLPRHCGLSSSSTFLGALPSKAFIDGSTS